MNIAQDNARWISIGEIDEVPRLGARVVPTPQGNVAVFRTSADEVFALDDRCPHKHGPLSQGMVHGKAVSCPLHNWTIDLVSGNAAAPDHGCAHTVQVKVEGSRIFLCLKAEIAA